MARWVFILGGDWVGSDGVLIRVHGDQVRFTFILTLSFLVSDFVFSLSLSMLAVGPPHK